MICNGKKLGRKENCANFVSKAPILRFVFLLSALVLLSVLFFVPCVLAVGMAGTTMDFVFFEPGLTRVYQQTVVSNTDKPMDHLISVRGDLAQYFTLSTDKINLPPEGQGSFTATMKLPDYLEPGRHSASLCVLESQTRGAGTGGGANIGTRTEVCATIVVFSPIPGKHADFVLNTRDFAKNENATIVMSTTNYGTETVNVQGIIEVFPTEVQPGKERKLLRLTTNQEILEKGKTVDLVASFNTSEMDIGEHIAVATLHFEDNSTTKNATFKIGELEIEILGITKRLEKNKPNKINVKVKSLWNAPIKEVYASVDIIDPKRNAVTTSIATPPITLKAWETTDLVTYWDTTGVSAGDYIANITLHYSGKTSSKTETISITEAASASLSSNTILIIALIILIILVIILLLRTRNIAARGTRRNSNSKIKKHK